ncbi:olfactomedin-like protein 2B isoform X3 [Chrysemys picta bellii]|uniref:olfactomedin-like protein 2B isoform X3 n=1 Tax=Chrysemys picta bellii TaxID=8478 RepID=UPI0032B16F3C
MAQPLVLLCCCAALMAAGRGAPQTATPARPGSAPTKQPEGVPEEEPLQNEADNQENILSQLLGDYDKVKAVSEGSNCQCKCLVRPLGRGACQRINEGASKAEDFYTVETITSGPDCKCACVAPPSALNPCEGDFRLKKLREAESSDLKLSSIIEMLESAFYGLDLLKLHSVTTKLVGRVEKLEEEVSRNLTRKNMDATGNVDAIWSEPNTRDKENCSSSISNSLPDIRSSLQRDAAAVYTHTEEKYEERFLQDEMVSQQISSVESLQQLLAAPEAMKPKQPLQRKMHVRSRLPSRPTIIRGITYYKAKSTESENDLEERRCKDTLSTISGPTTQNTYGRNEGAWMKDPLAKDERIYVTNYYYGNTLVEFRNLENFKQGRWSNSYKLPYSWIGTGHAVYNGSLYYNRAFTRNIIKYDLKQRYVAAWAMLHDVAYEEATPWRWQGHSDVDFAVDENGLWIIYPAINYEGFSQEVIVLSKLNAADLSTQKETTWRTGLRRNFYGNCFVICGVLYAVDSYNHRNANISYAFDTHTNTQIIPRLLFENEYSYITQIDYNPKDRLLYGWDNGHQVTYHVIFAY